MLLNLVYNHKTTAVDVPETETLSRAIWLHAGLPAPHLCDGLGRCGRCRVLLEVQEHGTIPPAHDGELAIIEESMGESASPDVPNTAWRLACRHTVKEMQGLAVHIPSAPVSATPPSTLPVPATFDVTGPLRLAVDVGTTSIQWLVLNQGGSTVLSGQCLNPQSGTGSDVMSRLAAAAHAEKRALLSRLILDVLRRLISRIEAQWPKASVTEICLAGNTAMTAIVLNTNVAPLLSAPYRVPFDGGVTVRLSDLPPLWIPPQPAPFVGGDIAAGIAWALAEETPFPFLFADMGTNGECVLALDADHALLTSVPLGPALEGIGLACGGIAEPGSIVSFTLGAGGMEATVLGGGTPKSLSGTGALSLLDVLLRAGVLSATGALKQPAHPLAKKLCATMRHTARGWQLPLPGGLFFTAEDAENILKVRAAFSVAIQCLLEQAQCAPQQIAALVLAGSLGQHSPVEMLARLGFIPPQLAARSTMAGNTSLAGAALCMQRPEWKQRISDWAKGCTTLDVTAFPNFMRMFTEAMRFGW